MRRSCENENTKIRNSLTNVHERPRRVCPSMAVLACACGLFRPRGNGHNQPTLVAVWPRSINKLMCIVTSAHDSSSPMLLAADDASPASKVLRAC